jgi:hypothetical protein
MFLNLLRSPMQLNIRQRRHRLRQPQHQYYHHQSHRQQPLSIEQKEVFDNLLFHIHQLLI